MDGRTEAHVSIITETFHAVLSVMPLMLALRYNEEEGPGAYIITSLSLSGGTSLRSSGGKLNTGRSSAREVDKVISNRNGNRHLFHICFFMKLYDRSRKATKRVRIHVNGSSLPFYLARETFHGAVYGICCISK